MNNQEIPLDNFYEMMNEKGRQGATNFVQALNALGLDENDTIRINTYTFLRPKTASLNSQAIEEMALSKLQPMAFEQVNENVMSTYTWTSSVVGALGTLGDIYNYDVNFNVQAGKINIPNVSAAKVLNNISTATGVIDLIQNVDTAHTFAQARANYQASIDRFRNLSNAQFFKQLGGREQQAYYRELKANIDILLDNNRLEAMTQVCNGLSFGGNALLMTFGATGAKATTAGVKWIDKVSGFIGLFDCGLGLVAKEGDYKSALLELYKSETLSVERSTRHYLEMMAKKGKGDANKEITTTKEEDGTTTTEPPKPPPPPPPGPPTGPPKLPPTVIAVDEGDGNTGGIGGISVSTGSVAWFIDPSGIAYSGDLNNPLKDVRAELWVADDNNGTNARMWNEAHDYDQLNPQITGADGFYAWDVPVGWWQVRLSKAGYENAQSAWLPVLPVQLGVNLDMKKIPGEEPPVPNVGGGDGGITTLPSMQHVIKAKAGKGGDISPNGDCKVVKGENQTFNIKAKEGFIISDVQTSDWFYQDVMNAYHNQLIKGMTKSTFEPQLATTRGMIVTILYRMANSPAVNSGTSFDDVAVDSYYATAIKWASDHNIVSGYGNGKFGPEDKITREQLASILYRYAQHHCYDVNARADLSVYADASQISPWANNTLSWANATGLIKGMPGNRIDPIGLATRAQVATIMQRFYETNQ